MDFSGLKNAMNDQFSEMALRDLFVVDITKDEMWNTYLSSFPEGSNPLYKERTSHDCQCCKQFIRACGNVVSISTNMELISIWDVSDAEMDEPYRVVANTMSKLIKSKAITNRFFHYEVNLGTDYNHQLLEDGQVIKWDHFYFKLPKKHVMKYDMGEVLSEKRASYDVFKRGFATISEESVDTVLELIDQKSIYRGEEHRKNIAAFKKLGAAFIALPGNVDTDNFIWANSSKPGARIRNTAIGTLLVDVSEGMDLDKAVHSFGSKMDGYKRPKALLVSKKMITGAQKRIDEKGFTRTLSRRNAVMDDLTINNVLFANRDTKKAMNVFDEMLDEVSHDVKDFKKIEEVSIDTFISSILPESKSIEVMFENRHENNLMSLVAPVHADAPGMFKWGNNFSWAYNGEVADSIREQVLRAGGSVNGVLRNSLAWYNGDDLDIHMWEPNGNHIEFRNKGKVHPSSGILDVDENAGGAHTRKPVENIIYTNKKKMPEGIYKVGVHQYSKRESVDVGFTLEMEYEGKIKTYVYKKAVPNNKMIDVVSFKFSRKNGITILKSLPAEQDGKELWNIRTQKFQNVQMIMNSPNHWDGEDTGNKHLFFILEGCNSDEPIRGFFNEFLKDDLTKDRKIFEILGSKMQTEPTDQLSGLGFSSTKRDHLICKVIGNFERIIKVNF